MESWVGLKKNSFFIVTCKDKLNEKSLDDICISWHSAAQTWQDAVEFCEKREGQLYFPNLNDPSLDIKLRSLFPGIGE